MDKDRTNFILDLTRDFKKTQGEELSASFANGLDMVASVIELKERLLTKDFSHVNLLDIVPRFDENSNSRVLAQLFEVRLNGQYVVFQSFVNRFFDDAFVGEIKRPEIVNERHRIDVLVQEEGSYAFIFENIEYNSKEKLNQA